MKKMMSITLTLCMILGLLAGCAGRPAVIQPEDGQNDPSVNSTDAGTDNGSEPVKTGLGVITDVSGSKGASAGADGIAQTDITLVAVAVDDAGIITDCVIDGVRAGIGFNGTGQLTTAPDTRFASKNELGENYGMKKASSIGREWSEQAAAMAAYAQGKTIEQLKGIAISETGTPVQADLAASVTISIEDFLTGLEQAVEQAGHLGARRGERLVLASLSDASGSGHAAEGSDGTAQTHTAAAVMTFYGDTITSCRIDAVDTQVTFNAQGGITSDLTVEWPTKHQLGDAYGMKQASSIGKEWYQQADAFCAYVTGKTGEEVASIAVDERTKPAQADLAAQVTIGIGDFQTLVAKAVGE